MTIGLFGGSFNPPHGGHLLLAEIALRRLNLDQLWWIVTPGNPLKDTRELAPLAERLAACDKLAEDPRIKVTAFEAARHCQSGDHRLRPLAAAACPPLTQTPRALRTVRQA